MNSDKTPTVESNVDSEGPGSFELKSVEGMPPRKLYRIGEVIEHSGFSRQTVHNYTVMGLIRESKWTQGGHRLYDARVFKKLAFIKSMKDRYRLDQIKRMLENVAFGP